MGEFRVNKALVTWGLVRVNGQTLLAWRLWTPPMLPARKCASRQHAGGRAPSAKSFGG